MIIVGLSKLEYENSKHYMHLHDTKFSDIAKLCKILPNDLLILKSVFIDLRNIKL